MEIKEEDLSQLVEDVELLAYGSNFKEKIMGDSDALSNQKYKEILNGYPSALDRFKKYKHLGIRITTKIEEYTEILEIFQNTFPDFYKKIKDTTQISRRKTIRLSDRITLSFKPGAKSRHSDTITLLNRNFDPNKTMIIRKPK